jgi:hypothetical protein
MITPIFDFDRSINAILYIADKLIISDFHKIFKILYISDREHLAKWGRLITGDTYIKMPNGPVPSKIYDILKVVRGDSFFSDEMKSRYSSLFEVNNNYLIKPLKKPNLDYLSESDLKEIDIALEKYGNLTFKEISTVTHDIAWNMTRDSCPISIIDIMAEAGKDKNYISYISSFMEAQQTFLNYGK